MPEATIELSSFFDDSQLEPASIDQHADEAYRSAATRERFEELLDAYARRVAGGEGDRQRLAIGQWILGRFVDALDSFASAGNDKLTHFYAARAATAVGRTDDALSSYQKAASQGWDEFECSVCRAELLVDKRSLDDAKKLVAELEPRGRDRASWYCIRGRLAECEHAHAEAIDFYEKAMTLDPDHVQTMFRLARVYDMCGADEQAAELYQRLSLQPRAHVNALINLAVLYEDQSRYDDADRCLRRVLVAYPNHARARLFLKDVVSGKHMVIDDAIEQQAETRDRLLDTPINEFELSVRARNCLKKMKIHSLGDLLDLSEPELLAFKNFGETSLNEIKALLGKRGMRLGQRPDEIDPVAVVQAAVAAPKPTVPAGRESLLTEPVSELELSVRARRCLQRLNVVTIGDLLAKSEPELLATRNFGHTSLVEIKGRLTELGLTLAPKI